MKLKLISSYGKYRTADKELEMDLAAQNKLLSL